MRLKDTTMEQRLISGFVSALFLAYGCLAVSHIVDKFRNICETTEMPIAEDMLVMRFYAALGAAGAGLICLYLWPQPPDPKRPKDRPPGR
jgi:hypothetical protein